MAQGQRHAYLGDALRQHLEPDAAGSPLRLSPQWVDLSYRLLAGVVVFTGLFVCLARISEYASGPAIVRFGGRTNVSSRAAGTVAEVLVRAGQSVRAGDALVRLEDAAESRAVEALTSEFELQLSRILREPANDAARSELGAVRSRRESAQTRLDERWVRAPQDGSVGSVRVRSGQYVEAGDLVATLIASDAHAEVAALIPGQHGPRLHAGMRLRLELVGFPYAYRELRVDGIGEQLVGPSEIRRFLGPDTADSLGVSGPSVVVRAALPNTTFSAEGESFDYYDGMLGTAAVELDAHSILLAFVPGLRDLVASLSPWVTQASRERVP